jgi:hypothetical protein
VLWYGFASGNGILVSQRYQDGVSQGIQEMVVDSTGWWDYNLDGGQNVAVSNNRLFFTFRGYKSESVSRYDIFGTVTDWYATSQPPAIWVDSLPDDIDSAYGPYPINAVIADDGTVDRAVLYYRIGSGSWDTLAMSPGVSDTFTAGIPEQFISVGDTITISYYVWTIDNAKNFISSPISSFRLTGPMGVEGNPERVLPLCFALGKAYPNPTRENAIIQYQLPKASDVKLQIYNITGQLVKTIDQGYKPAGFYSAKWNTGNLKAGVYIYRLKAGNFVSTQKLLVIK